jgi:glycosyltransferase involved in cell wall biosynthesis
MVAEIPNGVPGRKNHRILATIPMRYGDQYGFWTRDLGLIVLTLRSMGYDAWLVALWQPDHTPGPDKPVILATLQDLENPAWWQSQHPDAIILNTWSAPRYDGIRKAALAATPRVVERLDTSGTRSARLFPKPHFIRFWGEHSDRFSPAMKWLAAPLAFARTAVLYAFPGLMDTRMVATMKRLPAVIVESPVAMSRMELMFKTFSGDKHRVVMIPHPVNEEVIRYDNRKPKENHIITVGRWATIQKDFPMLRKVLKDFLLRHPDWKAVVVGSGVPERDRNPGPEMEEWQKRITYHDQMTHEELTVEYSRAKIYLMVSRYESFCIAAGEALCCGCSVVGSCEVPSSYFFAETESGQVAEPRSAESFLNTLDHEVECWNNGERKPDEIAAISRQRMGSHFVARETLALLDDLAGTSPLPASSTAT